jgi:hypothetical protein
MKEQGVGMMAAANKFQDTEAAEDSGDESPFEEVQKPVERVAAARPASAEAKPEAIPVASPVPKQAESHAKPSSPIKVSGGNTASMLELINLRPPCHLRRRSTFQLKTAQRQMVQVRVRWKEKSEP